MAVVTFSYTDWTTLFPEFSTVASATAGMYFGIACDILDNTDCSPVQDVTRRANMLNVLTAHIAMLYSGANGEAPSGLVGRVSNASEGSVSVGTDMGPITASSAWFLQTKYGALYWQMSAPFRLGRYVPGPSRLPMRGGFGWR